jgi:glycosyltransferase involved in cell wall biosynthesis
VDVCTIIAKNYVAQARVLARSFREHHPDGRLWTLIIDDFDGFIEPAEEPFEVLSPGQIGCEEFGAMAARYTVLELSTAVKPWLLSHLMRQSGSPITYLDPDIKVYGSLEALDRAAAEHGVALTPHTLSPIPADGLRPSQVDIMIAGVYNLGYLSLAPRPEVEGLLSWWADRLKRDCRVDPAYGYFVDQRWFDLVPGFIEGVALVREPEFNVAYWNLHERSFERDGERYLVDGRPLAFFHFSGFDPHRPRDLSRHQNRVSLADRPALERICAEYAADTERAGFATARDWTFTYKSLPGGIPFDEPLRRMWMLGEEAGELHGSPFTAEGEREFLDWLGARAPDAPPGVNRLVAHLYGTRGDLQDAYPEVAAGDLTGLMAWIEAFGREEVPALGQLPALAVAAAGGPAPAPPPPSDRPWGVNVVGYFRSELGVGEAGRQVIGALDAAGVPALPLHGDTIPLSRQGHAFTHFSHADAEFPVNLICMNADALPEFAHQAGKGFFAGRHSIGLWFWEVSRFRDDQVPAFSLLDELWLPSAHVESAIAPISPIPTMKVKIPVEVPAIVPRSRHELGLPADFLFLFSFDYRSVFERKNPLAVVSAFAEAFEEGDGASLVIKCINADADPANHHRLLAAAAAHPKVQMIDRYFDPREKDTLAAQCDCYVSLHRSEGFGFTMAEAMYLGKPVVATSYSGNLEFMTADNSYLVEHRIVPIGPDAAPYPPEGEWADPDVRRAAALMRRVFEDPEAAAATGRRAADDIRRTHSPAAAGAVMKQRLEQLRARGAGHKPTAPSPAAAAEARLRVQLRRGPEGTVRSGSGRLRRKLRGSLLRALRPYTAYQNSVNQETAQSLTALREQLDSAQARIVRSDAAMLAAIRRLEPLAALPAVLEAQSRQLAELKQLERLEQERAADAKSLESDRQLYLAVAELRRAHARVGREPGDGLEASELTPRELRAFSQNGEDGVLAEILARVGAPSRTFVEFGIESGREGNCVLLADVMGWSGLFIEADDDCFGELERKYQSNPRVTTLHELVTPGNVQALFARAGVPSEPDVVSIDVDGGDYWILEAIVDYRPRVVVCEYNSALEPSRRLVQPRELGAWDGTDYFGASIGALRALGERMGYRLVHTELSGVNAFLVAAELAEGRFPATRDVPLRTVPNYFQRGYRHPPDPLKRRFLDLDSEQLVDAPRVNGSGARALADDLEPVE